MHHDEAEHALFFENLIQGKNHHLIHNTDINRVKMDHWDVSLVDTLIHYYVGETYLFVSFYKIYKSTNNIHIKKQIKTLRISKGVRLKTSEPLL